MNKIIVKKKDGAVCILYPGRNKYGPHFDFERREIKEMRERVIVHKDKDEKTGKVTYREEKINEEVVVKVILPFEECPELQEWINPEHPKYKGQVHEWFVTDKRLKEGIESRKQLYWEGNEVKKDLTWEKRLMPDQLIKEKHLKRLQAKRAAELEKETPDVVQCMRWQNEHDICRDKKVIEDKNVNGHIVSNHDAFWLNKAVANLDEDGHTKPMIRQKIADKLAELNK